MRRVMVVYGTRPEAIKLAPVVRALARSTALSPRVVLTGQHRDTVHQIHELFGITPHHDLAVMAARQSLHELTGRILDHLTPVLEQERPDVVVVQGDTTSTFAAALAAFYQHVPVVHVEAGLRTDDLSAPFPEEGNRRLTTQLAALHLAPTSSSEANLLRAGVPARQVLVTGNTVIDALLWTVSRPVPLAQQQLVALADPQRPVLLVTTHRRESWGEPMREVASAVAELARRHPDLLVVLPAHPNPAVRDVVLPVLDGLGNVLVTEPLPYPAFAHLLRRCTLVLTDSGGVQEEAPSLGKPVLVLRDSTERPEGVEAGTARLIGTKRARVVAEVDRLLTSPSAYEAMARAVNPYGDGRAAARTVGAVEHLFGLAARPDPFVCTGVAAAA